MNKKKDLYWRLKALFGSKRSHFYGLAEFLYFHFPNSNTGQGLGGPVYVNKNKNKYVNNYNRFVQIGS